MNSKVSQTSSLGKSGVRVCARAQVEQEQGACHQQQKQRGANLRRRRRTQMNGRAPLSKLKGQSAAEVRRVNT